MLENLFNNLQRSVVVAMVVVRMMKASINQIIHMVAMRNSGVAAVGAMNMLRGMFGGGKTRSAFIGIGGINGNCVLVHVVAVRMMQMAVMKIVNVPVVLDGGVPASRGVNMRMVGVSGAGIFAHNF